MGFTSVRTAPAGLRSPGNSIATTQKTVGKMVPFVVAMSVWGRVWFELVR